MEDPGTIQEGGIEMKKALALMLVLLIGGVAFMAGTLWYRSDKINYRTDIIKYAGEAQGGGGILATYGEQTTRILNSNIDRLIWALTIGESKRQLQLSDRESPKDNVTIRFGEKLTITVWSLSDQSDKVFIRFRGPGKSRQYTLEGYKTMDWLMKIISPDGYWEPNELVEVKL
jgi:hypothetical protein